MSELKPCPHCGGEAVPVTDLYFWAVRCNGCGAECGNCKTEQEAIDAWNTRHVETCECESTTEWTGTATYYEHELSCGHVVASDYREPPNFCEECGRKVER